jgi:uncharacterized membrane protein YbhN (UPF0104 family)
MQGKPRRWWPVAKALVGLVIVFYIGRGFVRDLSRPELWVKPLHVGWLVPAALLYLGGMSLSALYWRRLLIRLGQKPPFVATFRAYFIGHLGKYVPGKALTLVLRAVLLRRSGVSAGLAGMTSFYEVLVTMTAGAVVAAFLFLVLAGFTPGMPETGHWHRLWADFREHKVPTVPPHSGAIVVVAVALNVLLLVPIVPGVFNRLANRLSLPFRNSSVALPPIRLSYLIEGLLLTSMGWPLLGIALGLALEAVPGAGLTWDAPTIAYLTAVMALSYVAAFVILIAPGALGVREVFLTLLLTPGLIARSEMNPIDARGKVLLAVLLLRLAWTTAELVTVGVLSALPVEIVKPKTTISGEGRLQLSTRDVGGSN